MLMVTMILIMMNQDSYNTSEQNQQSQARHPPNRSPCRNKGLLKMRQVF
jgi:hypothetical protein